jgi:hypothetical protein
MILGAEVDSSFLDDIFSEISYLSLDLNYLMPRAA